MKGDGKRKKGFGHLIWGRRECAQVLVNGHWWGSLDTDFCVVPLIRSNALLCSTMRRERRTWFEVFRVCMFDR